MAKLTNKQRIEIYERKLKGESTKKLSIEYNINDSKIRYLYSLINKHGYSILRSNKNRYYSKEFKLITINRVLIGKESTNSVAVDIGLSSNGILHNWIKKYKENCYNVVEKKRGRKPKTMTKKIKINNNKKMTLEEKIKELEKKNLYLQAENEYLKKLEALIQEREQQKKKEPK